MWIDVATHSMAGMPDMGMLGGLAGKMMGGGKGPQGYRQSRNIPATQGHVPLHWVLMGAAAISANAGTTLILSESHLPFLQAMQPFVDGVTLIIWAWGTWWIPLLIVFGIWAHGVRRLPLVYTPALWSMVFPLGMYSLSTFRLSLATQFPPLQNLGLELVWVAFVVWLATFTAMLASIWQTRRTLRVQDAPTRS